MSFERGFKSRCENIALSMRQDLGLLPNSPLRDEVLATYLNVQLIQPNEVPKMSLSSLCALSGEDSGDWSAVTVSGSNSVVVIYNPSNSPRRRSSDIAHEFAHIVLRHAPSKLMFAPDGTWTLRSFDEQQEEEATWLSGCLLLPRPALLEIANSGLHHEDAAELYKVSTQLIRYRTNVTGVASQIGKRRPTTKPGS